MPIPGENVEVVFSGMDQKTSHALQTPGSLERAHNVEMDKAGQLSKRRGYQDIESDTGADGVSLPAVFGRLIVAGDELLVLSVSSAWSLASRSEALQSQAGSRAMIERGPALMGGLSVVNITTGEDASEDA